MLHLLYFNHKIPSATKIALELIKKLISYCISTKNILGLQPKAKTGEKSFLPAILFSILYTEYKLDLFPRPSTH
jgi:hypothetical protein